MTAKPTPAEPALEDVFKLVLQKDVPSYTELGWVIIQEHIKDLFGNETAEMKCPALHPTQGNN